MSALMTQPKPPFLKAIPSRPTTSVIIVRLPTASPTTPFWSMPGWLSIKATKKRPTIPAAMSPKHTAFPIRDLAKIPLSTKPTRLSVPPTTQYNTRGDHHPVAPLSAITKAPATTSKAHTAATSKTSKAPTSAFLPITDFASFLISIRTLPHESPLVKSMVNPIQDTPNPAPSFAPPSIHPVIAANRSRSMSSCRMRPFPASVSEAGRTWAT